MATLNVNPTTGDGYSSVNGQATWAGARDAATGDDAPYTGTVIYIYGDKVGDNYYVSRGFVPFNTSALTDDATVVSATLTFYVSAFPAISRNFHAVQTSQASTTQLITSDFNNLAFVSGGSTTVNSTGSKVITLNATGLSWISKTGVSMIGITTDKDINNTTPTDGDSNAQIYSSIGTTPPVLSIEYSLPSSGFLAIL
jgi:hypothetical protein